MMICQCCMHRLPWKHHEKTLVSSKTQDSFQHSTVCLSVYHLYHVSIIIAVIDLYSTNYHLSIIYISLPIYPLYLSVSIIYCYIYHISIIYHLYT